VEKLQAIAQYLLAVHPFSISGNPAKKTLRKL
jgi:hypothetical protein